jgi:hypothetical protein
MTSHAQPPVDSSRNATAEVTPNSRTGEARIAAAPAGQTCLQTCGIEARSGVYTECVSDGGVKQECGVAARVWYRECIESECSEADIQLDTCRTDCRTSGAAAREACAADAEDAEACTLDVRAKAKECVADCE